MKRVKFNPIVEVTTVPAYCPCRIRDREPLECKHCNKLDGVCNLQHKAYFPFAI